MNERKNEKKYAWVRGCEAPDGDRQFSHAPLGVLRFREARRVYRHRRLIHRLAPLAPARDRLIATGARVFLPTHVITRVSLVLYELGIRCLVGSQRRCLHRMAGA